MNILFVHQNFPGQFKFLAPALVQKGHRVVALLMKNPSVREWQGVELVPYQTEITHPTGLHPWLNDTHTKVSRGHACLRAAEQLRRQGFYPDLIVAHPSWGESLFLKDLWPQARLGIYCEFFYQAHGADVNFDPEFSLPQVTDGARIRLKNICHQLHFDIANLGLSPTNWQASTFPAAFRDRITVVHEGIDTQRLAPQSGGPGLRLQSPAGAVELTRQSKVVTFVSRHLEPYRGYHIFMRALPELLQREPDIHVVLVGGDGVSYGQAPDVRQHGRASWKDIFAAEVRPAIRDQDWQRVHFVGQLPYAHYLALMQLSTVHVYLTYPFVLSWSLLEAMSLGRAIVASKTAPVQEVIHDHHTGRTVDFFAVHELVNEVSGLLRDPQTRAELGRNARLYAQEHFDLKKVCLPAQLNWIDALAGSAPV